MKIEDLSVGNWVLHKDTPVQVNSCFPAVNQIGFYFSDGYDFSNVDRLKPMPLTDKIFEINGAIKRMYEEYSETYYFPSTGCFFERILETDYWYLEQYAGAIEIRYVHELQNLLKLVKNWNQEFKIE